MMFRHEIREQPERFRLKPTGADHQVICELSALISFCAVYWYLMIRPT
jgi:hypothetical protein